MTSFLFLAGLSCSIVGYLDGNTPLACVGGSMLLLALMGVGASRDVRRN